MKINKYPLAWLTFLMMVNLTFANNSIKNNRESNSDRFSPWVLVDPDDGSHFDEDGAYKIYYVGQSTDYEFIASVVSKTDIALTFNFDTEMRVKYNEKDTLVLESKDGSVKTGKCMLFYKGGEWKKVESDKIDYFSPENAYKIVEKDGTNQPHFYIATGVLPTQISLLHGHGGAEIRVTSENKSEMKHKTSGSDPNPKAKPIKLFTK